jgi:predicted SAM-dependent methyltransferase
MGSLRKFDLKSFCCDVFFETGVGTGDSLMYAYKEGRFSKLYSVEIHPETARVATSRFRKSPNIKIINSDSASALSGHLNEIDLASRVLFFLDAHFPGEVSAGFQGYKKSEPTELKLPLRNELQIIKRMRPTSDDIIIIDDLRIYEDGPFDHGNMPEWAQALDESERNINFVYETFPERKIIRDYSDEGYLLIIPKDKSYRLDTDPVINTLRSLTGWNSWTNWGSLGRGQMSLRQVARRKVASFVKAEIMKRGYRLVRNDADYPSETSKCRERLAPFCLGYGIDLGFGGDPITDTAIRIDMPQPYARTGTYQVQLGGDARKLHWFNDGVLDYVYSSHVLEDFEDTRTVLLEWLRVLRPGGRLVIFCPDEQVYREHCRSTGQRYNEYHKVPDFSLAKAKNILTDIGGTRIIHENPLVNDYSWELVAEKL